MVAGGVKKAFDDRATRGCGRRRPRLSPCAGPARATRERSEPSRLTHPARCDPCTSHGHLRLKPRMPRAVDCPGFDVRTARAVGVDRAAVATAIPSAFPAPVRALRDALHDRRFLRWVTDTYQACRPGASGKPGAAPRRAGFSRWRRAHSTSDGAEAVASTRCPACGCAASAFGAFASGARGSS
jgi:hypothetical protein